MSEKKKKKPIAILMDYQDGKMVFNIVDEARHGYLVVKPEERQYLLADIVFYIPKGKGELMYEQSPDKT